MEPKYPNIHVKLSGQNGNAFNLLGIMQKKLKDGKVEKTKIDEFLKEAMSGDYDHLLQTCAKWVDVT